MDLDGRASAQGDNTEGAWKLIEYLGSEEAQTKQAELGVTMSAYEGVSDTWINSHPEFNMQVYLDMMENSQPYPSSKNTQVWFQMEQDKMVDAFSGAKINGRGLSGHCRRNERFPCRRTAVGIEMRGRLERGAPFCKKVKNGR